MKKEAVEFYCRKKISLGKAAEIAGISVREMLEIIYNENILLNVSKKSLQDDFKNAS